MLDRILHPDRSKKSQYEGKMYNLGREYSTKNFQTAQYQSVKDYPSKSFTTKAYEGIRESWMTKLIFPEKKLPGNLQMTNRDAGKIFPSKEIANTNFAGSDRQSAFSASKSYPTKFVNLDRKSQQALDNERSLQDKVKRGLSEEDVRILLNKAP